ncbi:adenine nucleotide alpha hydrolases-like protein, partial [Polychaeton citri CBS 116435]
SPPPPAQYRSSVSFDTFSNPSASDFTLTLNRKHKDYAYTKRSRTFLCGTDTNDYSDTALEWLIDELVDDGDEVVCLRVVEKDSREAIRWQGGHGEKGYRLEAERFLESIEKKNTDDRAISLVLEFAVGKVHDMIQRMIRIYEPAMLVVGTRGRSLTGYSGLLSSGSVSKYCLQHSPVPVIVVRPSSKREKKKRKRLRDPSRTGYRDILDKA